MAKLEERLRYIIEAIWKGQGATAAASREIADVGKAAQGSTDRLQSFGDGLSDMATIAAGAVAVLGSIKTAVNTAFEGAEIERTRDRFEALTQSIGSTADTMMSKLKTATQGLVSDAELMASAGQLISLGLADTEDGVVKLADLIAKSGWDMQQVIMTFANDSKMRLDALGLSVTDVEERMKAYTDAGMAASEAFDLAVIDAGTAKLQVFGDQAETTAGQLKILENATKNFFDEAKAGFAVGFAENIAAVGEEIGFLGKAFGLTESEFGKLLGLLASPQPQKALDFLDALAFGVEGSGWSLQIMADGLERVAAMTAELASASAGTGREGGLLGNLIGDPGESLVDLQARLEAINAPMREMIRLRDEAARAATTERRQEFGGFVEFDTSGMSEAQAVMVQVAAAGGTAAEQLHAAAGATEAVGDAMIEAAVKARGAKLGEAMAAGLITGEQALADLQAFADGLTLENLFKMDEPIAGSGAVVESAKQEMLRVVEGMETAVTSATTPAIDAIDKVDEALKLLDEVTAAPEVDPGTEAATDELETFRRYFNDNIASLSAVIPITYVVEGGVPGAPPPPGRASGGPVSRGTAYVVGEKGPEVFVPHSSGWVVPNGEGGRPTSMWAGGGGPVTVNQNFNGLGLGASVAVARRVMANYTRGTR